MPWARTSLALILCLTVIGSRGGGLLPLTAGRQVQGGLDVAALIAQGLYERAEAEARVRLAEFIASDETDSGAIAVASRLLARAMALNGHGTNSETVARAEQALQIDVARSAEDDPATVPSLLVLGEALTDSGAFTRAIATLERAVGICVRRLGPDSLELAEALDALAFTLTQAGHYARALDILTRSLTIRESAGLGENLDAARTLETIASARQQQGDYPEARRALERAMRIHDAVGLSHPRYVRTLNLLALQLWFEGRVVEARAISRRAIETTEQLLRADHPDQAHGLTNLAFALASLGNVAEGHRALERALDITRRNLGPRHYETALRINDLANSSLMLGDYPAARTEFEQALSISEAVFGPYHDAVATPLHNLALVNARLGDYGTARQQHTRAMAIWERVFGRDHPFVAVALTELAQTYREGGELTEGLGLLERALAIRETSLGTDHPDVARTLADIALTESRMGRDVRAQALAARALAIWDKTDATDSPDHATVLNLYAELQATRGDTASARRYYERAAAMRARALGTSHPLFAETQAGLALALAKLGNRPAALDAARQAEDSGREHMRLMSRYLPERQSLDYAASRPRALDLLLSLVDTPGGVASALDAVVRSRALVLDEMAGRQRVAKASQEGGALWNELVSARQRYANLVVRGPGGQASARYTDVLDDARRQREAAERALAELSVSFRDELANAQAGLTELRRALPPGSALVSFVRYENKLQRNAPSYLAFVLDQRGDASAVPLGPAESIDRLIARWRADVAAEALRSERSPSAAARSPRDSGTRLRRAIWDPLAGRVAGATTVFVVPDGSLSLVPLVALPGSRSEYLLEEAAVIHYLSAERDLVETRATTPGHAAVGLLALGGPSFDEPEQSEGETADGARLRASTCGSLQALTFARLDGTLEEAREVVQAWGKARGARLLVASEASERVFKDLAPRRRVLHLATHGFFLGPDCTPAAGGVRAVGGLTPVGNGATAAVPDNPLLLSGLALAGANRRASAPADRDDGILTAEEIAGLDLQGVEWAVLSACDTGLGEIRAGEGVFGLRRAFQIAGARTIIMSLWSVEDQATRVWMRALYDGRLQRKLSTTDAVREASLTVLHDRRARRVSTHPFYWAAFVAVGDWK